MGRGDPALPHSSHLLTYCRQRNGTMLSMILALPITVVLVLGAATDVKDRRVPNQLVLAGLPLALLAAASGGLAGLPGALLAGALVFVLGFVAFAVGAIGGGDAKFLALGALTVGWAGLVPYLLAFGVLGGLLAVVQIARQRKGLEATVMTLDLAKHVGTLGRLGHRARLGDEDRMTVPYAVAIAGAALLILFTPFGEWLST